MKPNLFLFLFLFNVTCYAQELIPMGTWRSHFNYQQTTLVELTDSKVFAATSHGLLYYDLEDQSINKLSKVDGLSDVGITALAYNLENEYLSIGYTSGNVDIITSDGIQNLPILLNSSVTENKTVNHISFVEGNMNLSTDFGLLVLSQENVVEEAYQNLGENGEIIEVRASSVLNDMMYLATEDGVLAGNLSSGENLQDFNNWERFSGSSVYGNDILSVASTNSMMYATSSNSLYKLANTWQEISLTLGMEERIVKIREGANDLILLTNERVLKVNASDFVEVVSTPINASINDVVQDADEMFWYADDAEGLSRLVDGSAEHIILDGPLNGINKLKIERENVYAFPELDTDFSNPSSNGLGYSIFEGGRWAALESSDIQQFSNISDVVVRGDELLITSFGKGVLNAGNDQIANFTNSPLSENEIGTGNSVVSGIALDSDENLWISNFSSSSLLKWNGVDDWLSFNFGSSASEEPTSIGINSSEQVWMSLGLLEGRGLLVYEIESGLNRYVTAAASGLPSNRVNDVAFGKQDEIWFATDKGVAYFPFSFGVVEDQSIDVSLPLLDDGVLFQDQEVYALAIDGGNRIWMGAHDGLWLFEENINRMIYHFTMDNSPLPSNKVLDLEIHPSTGELFVATDQGIVSYRTNATEGTNTHQQVKIYPNPVLPDFEGSVGFSGLANNVNIKITTVSGRLVQEVQAAGGGASWDVTDYMGRRVSTGVYLVFSSSEDGTETFVGKVAVID